MAALLLPQNFDFGTDCLAFLLSQPPQPPHQLPNSSLIAVKDDQNATILHLAAELQDMRVLQLILATEGAMDCLESKDRCGYRPLHRSAAKNAASCAELLVKYYCI